MSSSPAQTIAAQSVAETSAESSAADSVESSAADSVESSVADSAVADASAAETTTATKTSPVPLGVYRGGAPNGIAGHAAFDRWTGVRSDIAVDFSPGASWDDITGRGWQLNAWGATDYTLVYTVPMFPSAVADSPGAAAKTTLKDCADGDFNAYWSRLGRNLVNAHLEDTIVRPGWEFNGDWFAWSAGGQEATWAQCFRSIVTAMRTATNQKFEFDWNISAGVTASPADAAYPGDDFVDYVGLDVYDWSWTPGVYDNKETQTPAERATATARAWTSALSGDHGLRYWSSWAAQHSKRLSLPEWGVATRPGDKFGGGDNAYFIEQMMKFIYNPVNHVGYASYFDFDAPDGKHKLFDPTEFPAAAKAYKTNVNNPPVPAPAPLPEPPVTTPGTPQPLPVCPPVPTPVPPVITPYTLWTSPDGQYNDVTPLDGTTIGWAVYAWVDDAGPDVRHVAFYLDNADATGAPMHDEYSPKYDLQGSASRGGSKPMDAFDLAPGKHTLTAKVYLAGGRTLLSTATFLKPGAPTPAPTCTPAPTTPTTPTTPLATTDSSVIRLSWFADHRWDKALAWSGVSNTIYFFLDESVKAKKVSYYLDDAAMTGPASSVATAAPFDFTDGQKRRRIDTKTLTHGRHTLTAAITYVDGTEKKATAYFTH